MKVRESGVAKPHLAALALQPGVDQVDVVPAVLHQQLAALREHATRDVRARPRAIAHKVRWAEPRHRHLNRHAAPAAAATAATAEHAGVVDGGPLFGTADDELVRGGGVAVDRVELHGAVRALRTQSCA